MTGPTNCLGCGAVLRPRAAYCSRCGRSASADRAGEVRSPARTKDDDSRAVLVIAVAFVGTLVLVLASGVLAGSGVTPGLVRPLFSMGLLLLSASAASLLLGKHWLETAGRSASPAWLAVGLVAGLLAFAINSTYVALVRNGAPPASAGWNVLDLIAIAVLPACIEEWLCRGVLWSAVRRVSSLAGTLVLTSALFALMHAYNGGFVFELPHRFLSGILFGFLRAKSGSLIPGVLAHFVNNLLSVVRG